MHSVFMAEAAALALATLVADSLDISNVTFLSDSQVLVQCINTQLAENPPDWRAKTFTQISINTIARRNAKLLHTNMSFNTTAHVLARQSLGAAPPLHSLHDLSCSNVEHLPQCPLLPTLPHVQLQSVRLLAASCC